MKYSGIIIALLELLKFASAEFQCSDPNCYSCPDNFLPVCEKCYDGFELSSLGHCEVTDKSNLLDIKEYNKIQKLKVPYNNLFQTITSGKFDPKNRRLSNCTIKKCIRCDENQNICVECQENYLLQDQICVKSTKNTRNSTVSIELVIFIILFPLFFTTIFCFLCIYLARKRKKKTDYLNRTDRTLPDSNSDYSSLEFNLSNSIEALANFYITK
ncbi:hypothetical protein SteCoe_14370 [Stentor coeruleus]|uniref:PSI domain-containing protein n=1 Tax=Stentor coeruleus TaxID=5963 RepID=A0A1R2C3Z7_9CILI|nr:hypothetical protein SteCoe_15326 [Stentor coeruleus]OMJ84485.1 hypothetical protein SteCoe_14370 [Stentor coeruleus]